MNTTVSLAQAERRGQFNLGAGVMLLFAPLALGSCLASPVFALFMPILVLRLLNEQKVLRQELPGYSEYCLRTRFRLVPFFW